MWCLMAVGTVLDYSIGKWERQDNKYIVLLMCDRLENVIRHCNIVHDCFLCWQIEFHEKDSRKLPNIKDL